jgi:aspartate racemase
MHKVYDLLLRDVSIPFLYISDMMAHKILKDHVEAKVVADNGDMMAHKILKDNINVVGFLGTKYTMSENFYTPRLVEKGIGVSTPDEKDQNIINEIIYNKICLGMIKNYSKDEYIKIINKMIKAGADGIILGCTEI